MLIKKYLTLSIKLTFLVFAFLVVYVLAAGSLIKGIPDTPTDPGPIPFPFDLLVVSAGHALVLAWIIGRSNWQGWKLVLAVAFAYYGTNTVMAQMETWYFLADLTVGPETLRGLFLAGIPTALLFSPLAVLVLGKWKGSEAISLKDELRSISMGQWAWKLALVAIAYLVLYFSAGYFIAWQNPELRAFYGGTDPGGIWAQLRITIDTNPGFLGFQFMRGVLWALFALPVIWMHRNRPWEAALLVALLFSVPFNIGHIMPNPLIPDASVRLSHMIETASSNFIFGLIVVWLLHRRHNSFRELFGIRKDQKVRQVGAQVMGR